MASGIQLSRADLVARLMRADVYSAEQAERQADALFQIAGVGSDGVLEQGEMRELLASLRGLAGGAVGREAGKMSAAQSWPFMCDRETIWSAHEQIFRMAKSPTPLSAWPEPSRPDGDFLVSYVLCTLACCELAVS